MPLLPYRFFSSLSFCRLSALITIKEVYAHAAAIQKIIRSASIDLGHSYRCCKNASWSKLTVATCSHNVINGPWCLKMAFGLILLSFLLSFCYRFVSRKFSPFVGHTYTWSSQKGWRSISSCIRTSGSYSTRRAPLTKRNAKHVTNMDESHTTTGST